MPVIVAKHHPPRVMGAKRSGVICRLTAVSALLTCGCIDLSEDVVLEVYTWWTETAENQAFEEVRAHHRKRHPDVRVVTQSARDGEESRDTLARHLLAGAPLGTFQANVGADLLRWAAVDVVPVVGDPSSESRIQPIDDLFDGEPMSTLFYEPLVEALRFPKDVEGPHYGIPIGIHRLNVLYYSTSAREAYRSIFERDFAEDISVLCPSDPDADALELRIAVGADSEFVFTLLVFENILPALAGPDFSRKLWSGGEPPSRSGGPWTEDVRRSLECLRYLSRSFVASYETDDWADAANRVRDGEAAFTVMGDWVNGTLAADLGNSVDSVPFPNTDELFVFTSDAFPLPCRAEYPDEVREFLKTIASKEVQLAFSKKKGSIPARKGVKLSDPRAQATQLAFESGTPLLATSGYFPPYFPSDELEHQLKEIARGTRSVEEVLSWLRSVYPLLGKWQERFQEGPGMLVR